MKLQFHRAILFSTLLFACPWLALSQQPSSSEPMLTQSEAASLVKGLALQEEDLEQSCHRIVAIYREMAVTAESDSASVRQLKRQYEHLAENEEKAALAAKKMATHYARLASLIEHSPDYTKTRSLLGDQAYRR
jgi:methyl-accepting chemotaxis protein